MCALIRELAIPLEDLTRLAIDCPQCRSTMIVNLSAEVPLRFCSVCSLDFNDAERQSFRALATAIDHMKMGRHKFSFRVPPPRDGWTIPSLKDD
jgi:hypothetical protein